MTIRIGINGFGRIGRVLARLIQDRDDMQLVAINSRADADSHAHLLQYDSAYSTRSHDVYAEGDVLVIDETDRIQTLQYDTPADIPWDEYGIECVIEATGKFVDRASMNGHLRGSVRKVLCAAPGKGLDTTLVIGVNEGSYDPDTHHLISNASCTTNALGPILTILESEYGITQCVGTTIHAATNSQNLLDNSHKKNKRLTRSTLSSMIPTSTGASKAITQIMPTLDGKIHLQAMRVPFVTVSCLDLVVTLGQDTQLGEVASTLHRHASAIIGLTDEELVSIDFVGATHSSVIDMPLLAMVDSRTLRITAWYDNERGYACRVTDMVAHIMEYTFGSAAVQVSHS